THEQPAPAPRDSEARAARPGRTEPGGDRRAFARRGRAAGANRGQRLRTKKPARRSYGPMIRILPRTRPRRLILLCGLVPTIVVAALSLYRPSSLVSLEDSVYDRLLRSVPAPP